jgi:hypothetical protein
METYEGCWDFTILAQSRRSPDCLPIGNSSPDVQRARRGIAQDHGAMKCIAPV